MIRIKISDKQFAVVDRRPNVNKRRRASAPSFTTVAVVFLIVCAFFAKRATDSTIADFDKAYAAYQETPIVEEAEESPEEIVIEEVAEEFQQVVESPEYALDEFAGMFEVWDAHGHPNVDIRYFTESFLSHGYSPSDIKKFSAIMAWESGWGHGLHCSGSTNQCLSYGVEQARDLGYHFETFEDFADGMPVILRGTQYEGTDLTTFVGIGSWNSADPNWYSGVSEILSYF